MIKLAMMFKDGMVLQRDKEVAVFGDADTDAPVIIRMQGKEASTMPGEDGKWIVQAGPFSITPGDEMEITQKDERIVIKDVAVGEVWLAGGQSNMEFAMRYDRDYKKELSEVTKKENPDIRFFDYPEVSYVGELDDADYTEHYGFWRRGRAEDLQWWSAPAYYFAKQIQERYKIPVGIIGCNWGGTNISCWLPEDVLKKAGADFYLEEYLEQTKDLDPETYEKNFNASPINFRTNQLEGQGHEIQDFVMSGDYGDDLIEKMGQLIMKQMQSAGVTVDPAAVQAAMPVMGPKHEWRPCGLYYAMLLQIVPYTLRGIIWYQGESDGDEIERAKLYEKTFPALIAHWRELFKDPDLPFLFVQLAPYERWMSNRGTYYGIVRKAQKKTADTVKNTGMAVITDDGMRWDIHPVKKSVVGHRLALQAENKVYGEKDVLCEAPLLTKVEAEDGKARLTFAHAGRGLYLAKKTLYGDEIPKDTMTGAKLLLKDGSVIRSEECRAVIDPESADTVILTLEKIRKDDVRGAAVADDVWYQVNLYNSADIPAEVAEV